MNQLPVFANMRGRPVLLVGEGEAADAKRRLLERAGARVVAEREDGVRLAFVALEDEAEATTAAHALKAAGLLVNVVDRPALCDFTTPAVVERGPLLVAVATGGASAGMAKAVRQRIERLLPGDAGTLAIALADSRAALRARWPDGVDRRRAIDAALAEGGPLDPMREGAAARVAGWLAGDAPSVLTGRVDVALASFDPDDLTLRTARLMGEADSIWHPSGCPPALLARARADAVRQEGEPDGPDVAEGGLVLVLHARFTNKELERLGGDPAALTTDGEVGRFVE